jgi:hypothetical protein
MARLLLDLEFGLAASALEKRRRRPHVEARLEQPSAMAASQ